MSLSKYFIAMMVATLGAWGSWAVVLTQVNPDAAGIDGILLFYASFFLALLGTFALVGLAVRLHTQQHHLPYYLVVLSFRQAVFFAALVVSALLLQRGRWLGWGSALLLVAALTLLEYIALKRWGRQTSFRR